ncbi:hypothetical protein CB1_000548014 [Camelus ferus]|nr:hypothetical protein CB1_000548014 [Camelus ferus]
MASAATLKKDKIQMKSIAFSFLTLLDRDIFLLWICKTLVAQISLDVAAPQSTLSPMIKLSNLSNTDTSLRPRKAIPPEKVVDKVYTARKGRVYMPPSRGSPSASPFGGSLVCETSTNSGGPEGQIITAQRSDVATMVTNSGGPEGQIGTAQRSDVATMDSQ